MVGSIKFIRILNWFLRFKALYGRIVILNALSTTLILTSVPLLLELNRKSLSINKYLKITKRTNELILSLQLVKQEEKGFKGDIKGAYNAL